MYVCIKMYVCVVCMLRVVVVNPLLLESRLFHLLLVIPFIRLNGINSAD